MDRLSIKRLDDSQVEAFDTEYVDDTRWAQMSQLLNVDFPGGEFTFLDVGGGNGRFADRLLAEYPASKGTVIDNSEVLLARNKPNGRKTLVLDSVENLDRLKGQYDVIFVNWLLHHVVGNSWAITRRNQSWTLRTLATLLTERGKISVFENAYDGQIAEGLPGWLIFQFTGSLALSGVARKLGANTAGVGVCFLSRKQWLSTISGSGLEVVHYTEPDNTWIWSMPTLRKICLHLRRRYVVHFWLRPQRP